MAAPLTCLRCGAQHPAIRLELDGARAPRLPRCSACDAILTVVGLRTTPLAFVLVGPSDADPTCWEPAAERLFWRALPDAPRAIKRSAEACLRRVVFGRAALDEKIRAWNAGLDDAVLECLKLDLRLRDPALRARPAADVRLLAVEPHRLGFGVTDAPGVWLPRTRYAALAAERTGLAHRWPALFRGPWVDHLRLRG